MQIQLLEPVWNAPKWREIIALISMDCVEPYLPKMGLILENIADIRYQARTFLAENLDQKFIDPSLLTPDIEKFLSSLSNKIEEKEVKHLYWWGSAVFLQGMSTEEEQKFVIRKAWRYFLRDYLSWPNQFSDLNLDADKIQKIQKIIKSTFPPGQPIPMEKRESLIITDWDQKVSALFFTSPFANPGEMLRVILSTSIRNYSLLETINKIREFLNSEEEIFLNWVINNLSQIKHFSANDPKISGFPT